MASPSNLIDIDDDNTSDLTTLQSGDTPTDPFNNEAPAIQALFQATEKAQYQRALSAIPREHQVKINGV
ncbi:hypothetical protein IFR05_017070, partial [Cadophora sp. M221]